MRPRSICDRVCALRVQGRTAPVPQFKKSDRKGLGAETPRSLALVGDTQQKRPRRAHARPSSPHLLCPLSALLKAFGPLSSLERIRARCPSCREVSKKEVGGDGAEGKGKGGGDGGEAEPDPRVRNDSGQFQIWPLLAHEFREASEQ